jgi:hypothetical protein
VGETCRGALIAGCLLGSLCHPEDGGSMYLRYIGEHLQDCRHAPEDSILRSLLCESHKCIVLVFRTEHCVHKPDAFLSSGDRTGNHLPQTDRSAVESQNRLRTYGHPTRVTAGQTLRHSSLEAFASYRLLHGYKCLVIWRRHGTCFLGLAIEDTVWYVLCCL